MGPSRFKAYVMAWDGGAATGPILYESAIITPPDRGGFQPVVFHTGGLTLTPARSTSCSSAPRPASTDSTTTWRWPGPTGRVSNVYQGGEAVYLNNGSDFSRVWIFSLVDGWNKYAGGIGGDLAFQAHFSPARVSTLPAPRYTITDMGTFGGQSSTALGINNAGQVVGSAYTTGNLASRAFLWENGVLKDLGALGGANSGAQAINDQGQIVGSAETSTGAFHAFLYSGGAMRDLGTLAGGRRSQAFGINNAGQIVGEASPPGDPATSHAFLYSGSVMQDLGTLGGTTSYALDINGAGLIIGASNAAGSNADPTYGFLRDSPGMHPLALLPGGTRASANAINDRGQIAGMAMSRGWDTPRAVLWDNAGVHDLGTLGGTSSNAVGINAAGQIVGQSLIRGDGRWHAFLYTGGVMRDLNDLIPAGSGWVLEQALDINDRGQIVGIGRMPDPHAFLLTPIPPPPAAPARLTAAAETPTRIRLTWTDESENETAFALFRKSATADWAALPSFCPIAPATRTPA